MQRNYLIWVILILLIVNLTGLPRVVAADGNTSLPADILAMLPGDCELLNQGVMSGEAVSIFGFTFKTKAVYYLHCGGDVQGQYYGPSLIKNMKDQFDITDKAIDQQAGTKPAGAFAVGSYQVATVRNGKVLFYHIHIPRGEKYSEYTEGPSEDKDFYQCSYTGWVGNIRVVLSSMSPDNRSKADEWWDATCNMMAAYGNQLAKSE